MAGGFGLARLDGRVLLVPLTAPGDHVEIEVPDRGSRARSIRIIEAGPDRIEPACRHYGQCGGCDLMHLSYPAQVRAKREFVAETINRIGARHLLLATEGLEIEPNPAPFASRIRATWQPTVSARAGYFRRGSHEVIEIESCPVLDPTLEEQRSLLQIDERTTGLTDGNRVSVTGSDSIAAEIEFEVAGERIRTTADAFFQANSALLDTFVRYVVEATARESAAHVLELYSGVGLFTIPLARRVERVDAVESSAVAVDLARGNAERADLLNVEFYCSPAERFLSSLGARGRQPAAVLVDPPRSGLSEAVLTGLVTSQPATLVYVSCDPATFARDARKLADAGYSMRRIRAFDLFPQTHHVEIVADFSISE